ncbi:hypothetical protein CUT44_21555 [Streptomyces carminius]|uniref:Uncharacterized protein n=1 Tax=Streptomyces carminius TaxID=2665496 RepID=A0A2M8LV51_9ACTN|nr:DUF6461 domain-containing protein [Streptomyces carminius]PJE95838.1 hypothetical protein CUT44_21555 [Streptomyces carminius]
MAHSVLFEAIKHSYRDQYGLTCVRGLPQDEVLSRLGVTPQAPYPHCTVQEAVERFGPDVPAVRVCRSGQWTFLLDVQPHGRVFDRDVLAPLSVGTEAVSAWHLLSSTTMAAHARDGEILAVYDDWTFEPPKGPFPERLNRALESVGFFTEAEESDDWDALPMILAALEREFDLSLSADAVNGPWPRSSFPTCRTEPGEALRHHSSAQSRPHRPTANRANGSCEAPTAAGPIAGVRQRRAIAGLGPAVGRRREGTGRGGRSGHSSTICGQ